MDPDTAAGQHGGRRKSDVAQADHGNGGDLSHESMVPSKWLHTAVTAAGESAAR
ncbi:hypothetical protein ACFFX0_01510 [Citricoccus parietis]|uniref:Uncharacterized protein n=1 Tax=Citricoccus parietis TaxID=592307 RepID=A0ABV5FTI6_9MICC